MCCCISRQQYNSALQDVVYNQVKQRGINSIIQPAHLTSTSHLSAQKCYMLNGVYISTKLEVSETCYFRSVLKLSVQTGQTDKWHHSATCRFPL